VSTILQRHEALTATLDKFRDKPFEFGKHDCIQMARFHARQLGYKLPGTGAYTSALGARRALRKQGVDSIEALLDKFFTRIAPAAALPGDLLLVPKEANAELGTVVLSVGKKCIGWVEGHDEMVVMTVTEHLAAWRL
jgi:hypothetical protein